MQTTKLEWKDTMCHVEHSQEPVPAKEAVGTGLGYIPYPPDEDDHDGIPWYSITHMSSGRRLHLSPCLVEEQAKRAVAAFAPLTNWNRSLDELVADPEYKNIVRKLGHIYDEIDAKFWKTLIELHDQECWSESLHKKWQSSYTQPARRAAPDWLLLLRNY